MWGRVGAAARLFGDGRTEAQEAIIGLVRCRQPLEPCEQRCRIVRQVARKGRDFGGAVECLLSDAFTAQRRADDRLQSVAAARDCCSRVARTAASATTSICAPENLARSIAALVMRDRNRSSRSWLAWCR